MNTPTPSCFELSCTECDARYDKLTAECNQLHAELERTDAIYQRACEVEHELRAELAKERARLDWLEQRGPWEAWIKPCGEAKIRLRGPIRTAIDAAMKEGA